MFRRFCRGSLVIVGLVTVIGVLSGCDELSDAAHSAKGAENMQQRRQHRNNEAINLVVDQDKKSK